jgi:uncharacterized membrane protein
LVGYGIMIFSFTWPVLLVLLFATAHIFTKTKIKVRGKAIPITGREDP